ncbi:hypothetical protein DH2020_021217 [Rehmannia glutinosa]|uniref:Uncharacterized protein n=1 Tax=Rehmannia glutinosa TaxID=99300 RepID=A0ABR0WAF3_REHGL
MALAFWFLGCKPHKTTQKLFHSLSTQTLQISSMASISPTLALAFLFTSICFAYPALSADPPANSLLFLPNYPPPTKFRRLPPPLIRTFPGPSFSSPPAPPPSDLAPNSPSPVPSPQDGGPVYKNSPSPAPAVAGGISHENQPNAADLESTKGSSGGMNGGQKAGVAIGVIAGACVVGAGVLVYKKRQQNIQRSQYGYAARREIL